MGKYYDIQQLATEYEKVDIEGLLTEIENWKSELEDKWQDSIILDTLETVEDIIIDNLYKE